MALKEGMLGNGQTNIQLSTSELIYELDGNRQGLKYDAIEGATATANSLVV